MNSTFRNILTMSLMAVLPLSSLGSASVSFQSTGKMPSDPQDSLRAEVLLKIVYEGNMVTPLVEVFINNIKIEAVFDTGSYGLRVLGGALNGQLTDSTTKRISYNYGDDKRSFGIRGRAQSVNIGLGNLKSGYKVPIMCIDSTRYGLEAPWNAVGDSATIQSHHFRSVSAIMGAGLRAAKNSKGVSNPLAQLPGNGKYIVRFPYFGGRKGKLILNPDTTDLKGFALFKLESGKILLPNGDSSWRDNELFGCAIVNGGEACQPTMLDTGNPDAHVLSKKFSGTQSVPRRSRVILTINDKAGVNQPVKMSFLVDEAREHGKDYVYLDETGGKEKIIFGTLFFFAYDVLYDQVNGIIGIKKK